jgi:hypothetical protein
MSKTKKKAYGKKAGSGAGRKRPTAAPSRSSSAVIKSLFRPANKIAELCWCSGKDAKHERFQA